MWELSAVSYRLRYLGMERGDYDYNWGRKMVGKVFHFCQTFLGKLFLMVSEIELFSNVYRFFGKKDLRENLSTFFVDRRLLRCDNSTDDWERSI